MKGCIKGALPGETVTGSGKRTKEEKRSKVGTILGKVPTSACSQRSQRDLWGALGCKVLLGEKEVDSQRLLAHSV